MGVTSPLGPEGWSLHSALPFLGAGCVLWDSLGGLLSACGGAEECPQEPPVTLQHKSQVPLPRLLPAFPPFLRVCHISVTGCLGMWAAVAPISGARLPPWS